MVLDIPVAYEPKEVAEILRKAGGMSEEVIAKVSTEITMGVPVKELLLIQEMARSDSKDGVIDYETYMDCFHSVHPDLWCVCYHTNRNEADNSKDSGICNKHPRSL